MRRCHNTAVIVTVSEFERMSQLVDRLLEQAIAQLSPVYLSFLSGFAQGFTRSRLEMYKCILYAVITADIEKLKKGLTFDELERSIRALKTQYRRISGRKNWNSYLLRYGGCVAYAPWWEQDTDRQRQLEQRAALLDRVRWREFRHDVSAAQSEQLKRFRFRHKRETYLSSLEARWAAVAST